MTDSNMWVDELMMKNLNEWEKYVMLVFFRLFKFVCFDVLLASISHQQTHKPHYFYGNVINVIAIRITMHGCDVYYVLCAVFRFSCIHQDWCWWWCMPMWWSAAQQNNRIQATNSHENEPMGKIQRKSLFLSLHRYVMFAVNTNRQFIQRKHNQHSIDYLNATKEKNKMRKRISFYWPFIFCSAFDEWQNSRMRNKGTIKMTKSK